MRRSDAYASLVAFGRPFVETREAAARFGLWALDRGTDPFVAAPYLTAPFPAYVSLWSALARHDMIEQIPRSVYVVSLRNAG